MQKTSSANDRESQLLREIGGLSDRVRSLRATTPPANDANERGAAGHA